MVVRTGNERVDLSQRIKALHHDLNGLWESSDRIIDSFVVEGWEPNRGRTDQGVIVIVEIVQLHHWGKIPSGCDSVLCKKWLLLRRTIYLYRWYSPKLSKVCSFFPGPGFEFISVVYASVRTFSVWGVGVSAGAMRDENRCCRIPQVIWEHTGAQGTRSSPLEQCRRWFPDLTKKQFWRGGSQIPNPNTLF